MPQLLYEYQAKRGAAGSLYDLSPYSIFSRTSGEDALGALKYGMGVMTGKAPGYDVLVPVDSMTPSQFEGIVMTGFGHQMEMDGSIIIRSGETVGLLRYGNAWVRVGKGVQPVYGDSLYLVVSGTEAGLFTNDSASPNITIAGRFLGGLGTGDIAPVELYNQKQV